MVDLYSKPTISGYNSNPPPDDDSTTSDNAVSWSKHVNKLAGPIKTLVDSINTGVDTLADSLFGKAVTAQSANFNLATSDYGKLFKTSNAITITLLTGSDAGGNFVFAFYNSDATNNLTLGRNGVNINGAASNLTIYPKTGGIAFSDGTDWWVLSGLSQDSVATISGNWTFSGTVTHSGTVTMSAKSMYWAKGADIVSAATLVLGTDGNMFDVTGSTGPITAITVPAGMLFMLQFDSTPTLTHHATNLNLPGAANITAVAGDRAICFATAANTVHILDYSFADSREFAPLPQGSIATTSGTAVTIASSIPAWVKSIAIGFASISTNGTSTPIIQLGDAGGFEVTGYTGAIVSDGSQGQLSSGFLIMTAANVSAAGSISGSILLTKGTSNRWFCSGGTGRDDATIASFVGGYKDLSDTLTQIRITMTNGTDAFDAGAVEAVFLG